MFLLWRCGAVVLWCRGAVVVVLTRVCTRARTIVRTDGLIAVCTDR